MLLKRVRVFYHHWMAVGFENHTDEIALRHVEKLAELGDEWGLLDLGYRYSVGKSVESRQDRAIFYLKKVSDQDGDLAGHAAYNIGAIYLDADSLKKSKKWFQLAAKRNHPMGMYNYALSLLDCWDGTIDKIAGQKWMERAAKLGCQEAIDVLARSNITCS